MHAPPAVPVTVPHVFARKGERAALSVRVPGPVTIRVEFPSGSRFDVVGVRQLGRTPKLMTKRTKTYTEVRVSRLKAGTVVFTVVAKKLPGNKATPVTTTVS